MIRILECQRCGWTWASRLSGRPKLCPCCKRKYWWRPKRTPAPERSKTERERYPIQDLAVGQSATLPWSVLKSGDMNTTKNNRMVQAVRMTEIRKGFLFDKKPTASGLLVTRLR